MTEVRGQKSEISKSAALLLALCAALFGLCLPAEGQQIYRIGYLRFSSGPANEASHQSFRQGLRELGYIEGKNLVIEVRSAEGRAGRQPQAAAELVRLKVDVIVTAPAPPLIRAAQEATRTIPIVMAGVYVDPVEAGFIKSLARPGVCLVGSKELGNEQKCSM